VERLGPDRGCQHHLGPLGAGRRLDRQHPCRRDRGRQFWHRQRQRRV